MGIDEELVADEAKLVTNTGDCGAEALFAQLSSAGKMAFDEPPKNNTGGRPESQFCRLEMEIHRPGRQAVGNRGRNKTNRPCMCSLTGGSLSFMCGLASRNNPKRQID